MQKQLLETIRFYIYLISFCLSIFLYATGKHRFGGFDVIQTYAYWSAIFLYFTLLVSPLYSVFPKLPYKPIAIKSRRALGISSFYFALLHSYFSFFGFIGGIAGLAFWSQYYFNSLLYGFIALIILGVMAITSIDFIMRKLGKNWKRIHRTIYIAGIFILLHMVTVTIHILNLKPLMIGTYIFLIFLFLLETIRLERYVMKKYKTVPRYLIVCFCFPAASILLFYAFFFLNHHTH